MPLDCLAGHISSNVVQEQVRQPYLRCCTLMKNNILDDYPVSRTLESLELILLLQPAILSLPSLAGGRAHGASLAATVIYSLTIIAEYWE
jgi:hypothetical protein